MKRVAVGIAVFVLLNLPGAVQAVPAGSLDPTFSGNGIARSNLFSNSAKTFVEIDSQNRVIVAGYNANVSRGLLLRYKANGALDTTWGKRYVPASRGIGGLVLVGAKTIVGLNSGPYDGLVARLKANGSLDKTFGSGGLADFGMPPVDLGVDPAGDIFVLTNDGAGHTALFKISPNGKAFTEKTVCLGAKYYASECGTPDAITVSPNYVFVGGSAPVGLIADGTNSALVGRFLPSGALDTSYGRNGYAWLDPHAGTYQDYSNATGVAVSPKTGQVWAVGQFCGDYCPHDGPNFVARFTAAGVLDWWIEADFGDCGGSCFASSAHPTGVALQSGKVVVVGRDDGDLCTSPSGQCFGIERLTASGVRDATFAGDGAMITTKVPVGASDVRIFNTKILVTGGQYVARYQG